MNQQEALSKAARAALSRYEFGEAHLDVALFHNVLDMLDTLSPASQLVPNDHVENLRQSMPRPFADFDRLAQMPGFLSPQVVYAGMADKLLRGQATVVGPHRDAHEHEWGKEFCYSCANYPGKITGLEHDTVHECLTCGLIEGV